MYLAVLVMLLYYGSAAGSENCSALKIPKCSSGSQCPSSKACVDSKSWCQTTGGYDQHNVCPKYENYLFDSCFEYKFRQKLDEKEYEYLFKKVAGDWDMAEMYCQSRGYHLVSLRSHEEFIELKTTLYKILTDPRAMAEDEKNSCDPRGELCGPERNTLSIMVWLGAFYNVKDGNWEYSDGTAIYPDLPDTEGLISEDFRRHFFWRLDFPLPCAIAIGPGKPTSEFGKQTADAFICKRETGHKIANWKNGYQDSNSKCITGFQCPNSKKCIIGAMYMDTQMCDGSKDCPGGEDELLDNCPHLRVTGEERRYIFMPTTFNYEKAERVCKNLGYRLPSIQTPYDVEPLLTLPKEFGESLDSKDFIYHTRKWDDLSNWILRIGEIGGGLGNAAWTENSGGLKHDPKYTYFGLVFDENNKEGTVKLLLKKDVDTEVPAFTICETPI